MWVVLNVLTPPGYASLEGVKVVVTFYDVSTYALCWVSEKVNNQKTDGLLQCRLSTIKRSDARVPDKLKPAEYLLRLVGDMNAGLLRKFRKNDLKANESRPADFFY